MKKLVWGDNTMRTLLKMMLAGIAMVYLAACSKTVQWEEEVPLNTGEVIWVKRTVEYTKQGGAGNPFDVAYRPERTERLEFDWNGHKYVYDGDARVILLAISPWRIPVLIAPADDSSWDWRHNYLCAKPHYVQLVPDESGKKWVWPPSIEPWLYGMSHNLMRSLPIPGNNQKRYTTRQRDKADETGSIQGPSRANIDPQHTTNDCKRKC